MLGLLTRARHPACLDVVEFDLHCPNTRTRTFLRGTFFQYYIHTHCSSALCIDCVNNQTVVASRLQ